MTTLRLLTRLVLALGLAVVLSAPALAASSTAPAAKPGLEKATFAGGCFWCMEQPFDSLPGVQSVTVGYTGGTVEHPSYEAVSSGGTGHAESVEIEYDPAKITYEKLLDVFWHNVDPLTANRQFCDIGEQYRTAIFTHGEAQKQAAEASKKALEDSHIFTSPIVTEIVEAGPFWPAEDYHQHFYKKNPLRYHYYRFGCGRDARLEKLWGKSDH